jgi:putative hydrolase of the HAD superfamily
MDKAIPVTTLFLDIGGVLLSNGWGHGSRRLAAEFFKLDYKDMEDRHHLTFVTYEEGKLTMKEYLNRLVFYQKRAFTADQFKEFMFSQTTPYTKMIEFIRQLKEQNQLKIHKCSSMSPEIWGSEASSIKIIFRHPKN